jgi:predicted nucleic acid-binding Zn ribbon protein
MTDPRRIDELLDDLLQALGVARPVDVAQLVENWAELAGEPWGERSRPVLLKDGELVVEVEDGTAATLLKYRQADLIERLGERLGRGLVSTIRVRMARYRK